MRWYGIKYYGYNGTACCIECHRLLLIWAVPHAHRLIHVYNHYKKIHPFELILLNKIALELSLRRFKYGT